MDDNRSKRIMRILILAWILILILCTVLAFLIALAFNKTYKAIQVANTRISTLERMQPVVIGANQPTVGQIGPPGPQGIPGEDGVDGKDSKSVNTIIQESIPGPIGPKGDTGKIGPQGMPGKSARELELRNNPITGDAEWRYIGDDEWQLLMKSLQPGVLP